MADKGNKNKQKYNKDLLDDYLGYLLRIFENEDKRLNIIEGKVSQLINQSGLIISLIAFIIPLFYDKLNVLFLTYKVVLGISFVLTIFLIGLSIYHSSKIFRIHKYKYADCSVDTLKKNFKKAQDFKEEYISDLIYSIENNQRLNDVKGSILIKANMFFIYGIYSLILLALLLLTAFYFF